MKIEMDANAFRWLLPKVMEGYERDVGGEMMEWGPNMDLFDRADWLSEKWEEA